MAYDKENVEKVLWKKLIGLNDSYEVSNNGQVRSYLKRNSTIDYLVPKIVKESLVKTHCKNYSRVCIRINGESKNFYTHRLVAKYFIENAEDKPQVNHIDNNPLNNNVSNLEWVTNSENQKHRFNSIENNSLYIYFDKRVSKFRVQIKHKGINSKGFNKKEDALLFRDSILL